MLRPGPRNLITDVPGIKVGNAEDVDVRSGVTVVLPDDACVAAVDVRGGAPGTRETDALDPSCLVEAVHAIVLGGGSAFGLDAASGTMNWLHQQGRGFKVGDAVIPIVPAAILIDLLNGGNKNWGDLPPYRDLGEAACNNAMLDFSLGNSGAGMGATAGDLKGGLGSASFVHTPTGVTVGALVAVNPFGSVTMPDSKTFWAWPFEQNGEFGNIGPDQKSTAIEGGKFDLDYPFDTPSLTNTTLAVVATDMILTKPQAQRVAIIAHDGLARAIRPVHTPLDGDSVFVLSTGKIPLCDPVNDIARIGTMAADCVARSIARGVYQARTVGDMKCYKDL